MRILRRTGTVAAPSVRVFALLEDPRLSNDLNPDFLRATVLASAWLPRPGARTTVSLLYRGARYEIETELVEYRRGSLLRERQLRGPFATLEHAFSVEETASGTQLTEVLAYRLPLGDGGGLRDGVEPLSADALLDAVLGQQLAERVPQCSGVLAIHQGVSSSRAA